MFNFIYVILTMPNLNNGVLNGLTKIIVFNLIYVYLAMFIINNCV